MNSIIRRFEEGCFKRIGHLMKKAFFHRGHKGFTLLEMMIVISIIAIIAMIAIPQFLQYQIRGYNSTAKSDAKQIYTAAQAYFSDSPAGAVNLNVLTSYGYNQTNSVNVAVDGTLSSLAISARHSRGTTTYSVDSAGAISE
jgi:prepilin-type N-terminal cleavage/methylation domain-containing protein